MFGGSQFDGAAAFSGGGFMPSQATNTADPTAFSPAKSRDSQTLLPVTVKQIKNALVTNDDKLNVLIDGVDVTNVTILGMVFNKAERVTDITFSLDDGTGRIECNKWINESLDTNEAEGITDRMYVRVHGLLKTFQGKRQLNVFSIRPVADFNEVASHFIECMYVHVYNTRLQKSHAAGVMQPQMANMPITNSFKGNPTASLPSQFAGQHSSDGINHTVKMVLDCLQRPEFLGLVKGAHINELSQQLNIPVEKIREAIHLLEEEGLVYSTIDEFHFKSTGNA